MSDGKFSINFHTIRRSQKAFPDGDMSSIFADNVNKEWKKEIAQILVLLMALSLLSEVKKRSGYKIKV